MASLTVARSILSPQRLSILFSVSHTAKTSSSAAKCSQEQHKAADSRGRSRGCGHRANVSLVMFCTAVSASSSVRVMSSNKEACPLDTMKAAASELHESQREKTKSRQEKEEKLILTAWRNVQHSLSEDSAAPGPPQSFLAKQRQLTQTRRVRSTQLETRTESSSQL